ncbi:MAG: phytanoyl-CoA dioxygenase family protein, partial [Gammaproteobacteria bacterium]|nr:phytanoyl-CoA dioxygenase family protein [Gammaproteobacteria bacterium]
RPEQLANSHTPRADASDTLGHERFLQAALDEDIIDLVASVLGEHLVMWGCQLFCKPGTDGREVPMHQDGQYWPIRPLATCTVWLALDQVDRDNGCMVVVPGSHRDKVHYGHRTETRSDLVLNQAVDDPRLNATHKHYLELAPGQMSLHDVYLVHGSAANRSGRRRAGLATRYMPTTSCLRRDLEVPFAGYPVNWAEKPLWLVRGEDVCGRNNFDIGHQHAHERATRR